MLRTVVDWTTPHTVNLTSDQHRADKKEKKMATLFGEKKKREECCLFSVY